MSKRWRAVVSLALGGLVVLAVLLSVEWILDSFTPGAGMSVEAPPQFRSDGSVAIRLEVSVWGSGGSIGGRYKDVLLVLTPGATPSAGVPPIRIAGRVVRATDTTEVREFIVPANIASQSNIGYRFELEFDGRSQQHAGHYKLSKPPATHIVPQQ